MSTFVLATSEGTAGPRVAVKDLLDWAGTPTTAGCRAVAASARAAATDAACLAGLRAAVDAGTARMVGKVNLHELADGTSGVNPWFGTPRNPLDEALVPGGSSSGSATAVASGQADWAVGTDTGGSVRIPAACCGVVGLKTSFGRIPVAGVWPLAPSLDAVGPLARDVAGVVAAMAVLDPSFSVAACRGAVPGPIGRLRPDVATDPVIDAAVDSALAQMGVEVVDIRLPGWSAAVRDGLDVLGAESAHLHLALVRAHPEGIGADVRAAFDHAATIGRQRLRAARAACDHWAARFGRVFDEVAVVALPTLAAAAPTLESGRSPGVRSTLPVNMAGLPALALPIAPAAGSRWFPSLQLVGPAGGDEVVCRVGAAVERAARRG